MERQDYPVGYVVVAAAIPDSIQVADWAEIPCQESRAIGDYWVDHQLSAVLRVPSVVVVGKWNYMLYPLHGEFTQIRVSAPSFSTSGSFDERTLRSPESTSSPMLRLYK